MTDTDFVTQTKAAIANITDPQIAASRVDLNTCDREPIHIPAAIQPHGVLLAVQASDWRIVQASQNVEDYLGRSLADLLDHPLSDLLMDRQIQSIQQCLAKEFEAVNPLPLDLQVEDETRSFAGIVHRSGESIVLELEPADTKEAVGFFDFYDRVKRPVSQIQQAQTLPELCQTAVDIIQQISGFERVMMYQFDSDGSGSVIAEAKSDDLPPYLGLHYPATDVPKQAKYLYMLNLLRLIPDAVYEPVPVVPDRHPVTNQPLDMSLSSLRSVSPIHTEYLANMGVSASMSISLVQDQELWGLIACHHSQPRKLSYELRTTCEFLGRIISLELANRQESEDTDYRMQIQALQASFVKGFADSKTLQEALTQDAQRLLGLVSAGGAVFYEKGEVIALGQTPSRADIQPLINWLSQQLEEEVFYETSCLSDRYPPAAAFSDIASGLLAISISRVQDIYILWFRPEVVQTVSWAGNPNKSPKRTKDGEMRMSPRQSFEQWKETVYRRSLPWRACETEAALELRSAVIGLVLQKADELAQLNSELVRSNTELDAFAYIASHDLKEPLRGIHSYSSFLIEDYGDQLGEDGVDKLNTLMRLSLRMEDLINSLLHYSRLGRAELQINRVDLQRLVEEAVEVLKIGKPEQVSVQFPRQLPSFECDRTQVLELFTNLISNAIKYNDQTAKMVEVGYLDSSEAAANPPWSAPVDIPPKATVFYIRDNGIGIRDKHLDTVFKIFKRLHLRRQYGGGTGAGLTIVKRIVERHGGRIWIDSVYGEGSTFYFTLEGRQL